MPTKLTAKQEKFCQELVKGATQTDAYKAAYNAKNMQPEVIHVEACTLAKDHKIAIRIEELKKPIQKKFTKTVTDLLQEIEDLKEDDDKKLSLDCIKEQGKMLGYYVNKIETKIEISDMSKILDSMEDGPKNT